MNIDNIYLLHSLNKTQYYQFIQTCLGITVFLNNNNLLNKDFQHNNESQSFNEFWNFNEFLNYNKNVEVLAGIDSEEEKQYSEEQRFRERNLSKKYVRRTYLKILAYFKINKSVVKTFLINERDYEEMTFRDNNNNIYNILVTFNFLGDSLLFILLIGICGFSMIYFQYIINNIERIIREITIYNTLNFRPDPGCLSNYDFILGAGVNVNFKIGNWKSLIQKIEKAIRTETGLQYFELQKFKGMLSNTNYISPQILKDYNEKHYLDIIYSTLYNRNHQSFMKKISNPSRFGIKLEKFNLFQVARIASLQERTTKVLTFNYDNVLEQLINNSFSGINFNSVFKNSKTPLNTPDIEIIHSHGYMPMSSPPHKSYSIIFSSFEYMEAYKTPNIFARKKLIEQLRNTNLIIGNSLSDYEEQKVFYANHRKFLSHFDYIFVCRNKKLWMDIYQAIYFYQMGVIPIFFDDFNRMNDYLQQI